LEKKMQSMADEFRGYAAKCRQMAEDAQLAYKVEFEILAHKWDALANDVDNDRNVMPLC
jgi:hypothetical protein